MGLNWTFCQDYRWAGLYFHADCGLKSYGISKLHYAGDAVEGVRPATHRLARLLDVRGHGHF